MVPAFDPAFTPRSTSFRGVLMNSVSTPALAAHGFPMAPPSLTQADIAAMHEPYGMLPGKVEIL